MTLPLPRRTAALIDAVKSGYHPGLALDKHLEPLEKAEGQKPILEKVCRAPGDPELLNSVRERRNAALAEAITWKGSSQGPLTLHLSRATALENAGIALHPIYGFAHLPGSGLKGLARAWAERIWLEAQPPSEREVAAQRIRAVFGYTPRSDAGKDWIPEEFCRSEKAASGSVVFHEAWPTSWPKLFVDIAAVHHAEYYQADDKEVPAPGDWEEPNPVCFLAIKPGTEFDFAVAPRRAEHRELAQQAREWLATALADWGAGAKTAAGYGRIIEKEPGKPVRSPQRAHFECTLELVTAAFLAGAEQGKDDCDLRGATLRGQLRWWWRTMHAGHLEPRLLRRLETAIWGATSEGSSVQLAVEPIGTKPPMSFMGGGPSGYLAYGMAKKKRLLKPAGSRWKVTLVARPGEFRTARGEAPVPIEAGAALGEARAALWLLTHYGGVGAKARKGFGSLADVEIHGIERIEDCVRHSEELRAQVRLRSTTPDNRVPSLLRLRCTEVETGIPNEDAALRTWAGAYRDLVKNLEKANRVVLGLPRADRTVNMGLDKPVRRHPSAIHFHLAKHDGGLVLRIAAFEIERLVPGAELLRQIESQSRAALATPGGREPPERRRDAPPRLTPGPGPRGATQPPEPQVRFRAGGTARLEGMRVRIIRIEGKRAHVLLPETDEPEVVDVDELDPDLPG